ncbi:MAG: UDP-2,3-diacylglucosamine diphosphatase [Gammaproteobacteria bacterium]|nr:UDP-2,3-diacylglucosamine diphosphatase [Gammaproteobacteria bacterium]
METLFISDLHLSPDRPEKIQLFKELLQGRARLASALYILGDLFDHFWVGNDDNTPPNPEIIAELAAYASANDNLFIIRGNRDLMLNPSFKEYSGCTVLPDQHVIELQGQRILLAHGDVFCTLDVGYQRYRAFMESAFTRYVFPRLPYALRIKLSHGLRPLIKKSSNKKSATIIDVEQSTVETAMRKQDVQEVIHGHTHRPGTHEFELEGKPATRTVLSDWYETDSILVIERGEKKMMRVAEYLSL